MTPNVASADQIAFAEVEVNTEKRDTQAFFAIVAALLVIIVIAGLTFGLAAIGAIGIAEAASLLVICVLLTAG
jgi:type IV secretory pathway VirB6-like protein